MNPPPGTSRAAETRPAPVLGEEPDTGRSLAAVLKLAAAKGYLDKDTARKPTVVISSSKKSKLEARSYTIEEKRDDSRRDRRGRGEPVREVKESDDYKPDINLEYTDDAGRKLETPKEAFRYMCHKFHGKGPGKNKIDKRLRKQQLESQLKEALATDGPPASAALMISKQKELKSPYIILSKGK